MGRIYQRYPGLFSLPSSVEKWEEKLDIVEEYVQIHDKLPNKSDKDTEISSLGAWIARQKNNYKNASCIMNDEHIQLKWEEFTQIYSKLFI